MRKIDKILDMFDELFETQIQPDEAVFIVANSFYTSKDERINRDTLFRYIKSQMDITTFHTALVQKDMSIVNPERYPRIKNKADSFIIEEKENAKKEIENITKKDIEKIEIKKENKEKIIIKNFSPEEFINEINSLREKLDIFVRNYSQEKSILEIPKEMINYSEQDIKRVTFRVEKNILNELEEFFINHREYSKTSILNFMIKEFIEKYKK